MKAELGEKTVSFRGCGCVCEGLGCIFLGYAQLQQGGGDGAVLGKEKLLDLLAVVPGVCQIE